VTAAHGEARDELGTWRAVMAGELARVRLTLGEARLLADALAGQQPAHGATRAAEPVCYARCHDLLTRGTGDQYEITEDRLLAKLQLLGPAADIALEDAFARWRAVGGDPTRDGFTRAGLLIVPGPVA